MEDNEAKNGQVLSDQKIILYCLFVNPVTDFAIADKYFFTFKEIIEIFVALQDHRFNNILLGVVYFSKMGDSGWYIFTLRTRSYFKEVGTVACLVHPLSSMYVCFMFSG